MSIDTTTFYAGDRDHDVEAVVRFSGVKRWHMINTQITQTLAEHSANVALLAFLIAKTTPGMFFGDSHSVATHALIHDLSEVFTGDIPTPTKRYIAGLDDLERKVTPTIFETRPGKNQKMLIKLCDLGDGIRFIRLHGVDSTGQHAMNGLNAQYQQLKKDIVLTDDSVAWPRLVQDHVFEKVNAYVHGF